MLVINLDGEIYLRQTGLPGEAYAHAKALIRQTKQVCHDKIPEIQKCEICGGDISKVSGRTSFDAMRAGDDTAKRVVDRYIEYVVMRLSNNINIFPAGCSVCGRRHF